MSMGVPSDVEKDNAYRDQFALMLKNTSKPLVFVCDDRSDVEAIVSMAACAAGGLDQLRVNPSVLLYSEPSSPLKHTETAVGKLLYMAEQRLPVVHSPAPVQGGTGPVSLPSALAMANAEVLSGLTIHQLAGQGAPFVYGCGMHQMDMATGITVFVSPEFLLTRIVVAEMGRFYGLPTWGYAGDSNSCSMDEQAAAEITASVTLALQGGNNLVHDVGYLETGRTASPENMVFTNEVISMMRRTLSGFSLDEESLALDLIDTVGPDGDFLTTEHTYEHFRQLWRPQLFSRLNCDAWVEGGARRLGDQLRDRTVSIMEEHRPEPLPASVVEEIDYILRHA
jgi:trimethylamine--corrinoid protein Co-methyltransferase